MHRRTAEILSRLGKESYREVASFWQLLGTRLEGSGPVQVRSAEAGRLSVIGFRSAIALRAESQDLAASQTPSIDHLVSVQPSLSPATDKGDQIEEFLIIQIRPGRHPALQTLMHYRDQVFVRESRQQIFIIDRFWRNRRPLTFRTVTNGTVLSKEYLAIGGIACCQG
jgi:hypothetical protein